MLQTKNNIAYKVIMIFVLAAFLISCVKVRVHAVGVGLTAAEMFMSLWGMYSSSMGLDQVFKTNGVSNNISNPFDSAAASDSYTSLFNRYMQSIGSNQTIGDWVSWALDRIGVAQGAGRGTVWRMSSDLVEFFDHYGTYVLEDVVGIVKDAAGKFSTLTPWYYNTMSSIETQSFTDIGYYFPAIGTTTIGNGSLTFWARGINGPTYAFTYGNLALYIIGQNPTSSSNGSCYMYVGSGSSSATITGYRDNRGVHWTVNCPEQGTSWGAYSFNLPHFATLQAGLDAFDSNAPAKTETIQLRPKDQYNEGALGIPDVDAQDYAPDAITGTMSRPWDGELDATGALTDALAWVKDKLLANVDIMTATQNGESNNDDDNNNVSNDPDLYAVPGLSDVFPFCLPFDLYAFFACLAADPVAPSFEIPIEFEPLDLTYTFEIDLSEFNSVAAILRKVELLGFCVALILITRSRMIRG